jgi:methylglutaconyl-CoA hydratase
VLRSAVPGVFCAGADLKERATMTRLEARRFVEELRGVVGLIEALPFPTVAAVDGVALGGGAEVALAADVRVVGPRASFGFPETRLGIIPG